MKQYFKNTWDGIWTVLVGMKITFRQMLKPSVTIQYPDVKVPLPERVRNRLYVNMDDCIGCDQCARACPVNCITIETAKSLPTEDLGKTSNGKKKVLWVTQFDIDIAKCCYCQLCVFPCPTECIYMTDVYEFSEFERENLIYNFSTLTEEESKVKIANFEKMTAEKEAKKAAAAKAKAEQAAKPKPVPKPAVKEEGKVNPDAKPNAEKVEEKKDEQKKVENTAAKSKMENKPAPDPYAGAKKTENEEKKEIEKETKSSGEKKNLESGESKMSDDNTDKRKDDSADRSGNRTERDGEEAKKIEKDKPSSDEDKDTKG